VASSDFSVVRGMRDMLPDVAKKKQAIEDRIRKEFEAYGFEPIETPIVEDFALLSAKGSAGESIKDDIYYFKDKADRELGLRFDLTVPLARVIVNNPQLVKPFKRYQIGKVYRYDKPGASRYREFTQADVDIVGSSSIMADYECVALAYKIMKDLSFNFSIRVSNKKLLADICLASNVPEDKVKDCMRSIDKMDKVGVAGVKKELSEKGIPSEVMDVIGRNDLKEIAKLVKDKTGLNELQELLDYCEKSGLTEFVKFDASLARGLEYYTGNVFEVTSKNEKGEVGPSVGGGGRYDNLVETYGGPKTPCVGISFGVDRLVDLREKELCEQLTQLMIVPIGLEAGKECLKIGRELRAVGLNVENDLMQRSLQKNLEYANKKRIPFVAIIGENEIKEGVMAIKNLTSGKQEKVKLADTKKIKELIKTQEETKEKK